MKLKIFCPFFCLLFFASKLVYSGNDNSAYLAQLIKGNLAFHSKLEDTVFSDIINQKEVSIFKMMLATDKYTFIDDFETLNIKLDNYCQSLALKYKLYSKQRKINAIFKEVHNKYLKKYELKVLASDLLLNGNYNCVTATAFYAHIFKKLDIKYEIKEMPTHVFLVAEPDGENIIIETTDPVHGYLKVSSDFKKNYLQQLINNKIISIAEFNIEDKDELFNKYFYAKTTITDKELVALQYSNIAIYKLENAYFSEIPTVLSFLEKSFILYPSLRTKYMLYDGYGVITNTSDKLIDYNTVVFAQRFFCIANKLELENKLKRFYYELTNTVLMSRGDDKLYKVYTDSLLSSLKYDTSSVNMVKQVAYRELARFYFFKEKYDQSFNYLCEVIAVDSQNVEMSNFIGEVISKKLKGVKNPEQSLTIINSYFDNCLHLKNSKLHNELLCFYYLKAAVTCFTENKREQGVNYINLFEALNYSYFDEEVISYAYIAASISYGEINNIQKVKYFITKGLKFAPANQGLLSRKREVYSYYK